MTAMPQYDQWDGAAYLAFERESQNAKHELINGAIVAMSGASRAHNLIAANVGTLLNMQLRERNCEVYIADMRVQVQPDATYTYPDVVVVCGEPQFADEYIDMLLNPTLLIEVLSPSTEVIDRRYKLSQYRALASVQDYLLVTQDTPRIEQYTRHEAGWMYTDVTRLDDVLILDSISCELPMNEIYRKVNFDGNESQ